MIGDITKEEDCNRLVDKAVEKFGYLNVLVCSFHYVKYTFTLTTVIQYWSSLFMYQVGQEVSFVRRRMRYLMFSMFGKWS